MFASMILSFLTFRYFAKQLNEDLERFRDSREPYLQAVSTLTSTSSSLPFAFEVISPFSLICD